MKVGGVPRVRLSGEELRVVSALVAGRVPEHQTAGAATDDKTRIMDCVLPLNLPTGTPSPYYSVDYSAVSGVDTTKLTIIGEYQDEDLEEAPLRLLEYSFTPPSTGAMNKALDTTSLGEIDKFLIYSTTVPTDSSDNASCDELELWVAGDLKTRTNVWQMYHPIEYLDNVDGTITAKTIDKWLVLEMKKGPIPPGTKYTIYILSLIHI